MILCRIHVPGRGPRTGGALVLAFIVPLLLAFPAQAGPAYVTQRLANPARTQVYASSGSWWNHGGRIQASVECVV